MKYFITQELIDDDIIFSKAIREMIERDLSDAMFIHANEVAEEAIRGDAKEEPIGIIDTAHHL